MFQMVNSDAAGNVAAVTLPTISLGAGTRYVEVVNCGFDTASMDLVTVTTP
jgi:hypothetical protein